jgi:hypothetical protein|tara:strand:+ start:248 stop:520 length:273 start_codon:yes stop_codon:yes gene_type:complete
MEKKINKEHYESLINDYVDGKARIQGDHPEDVHKAIDSFFYAGKMLVDHPEIGHIPAEYVEKLISTLAQHPQYHPLVMELISIINDGKGE